MLSIGFTRNLITQQPNPDCYTDPFKHTLSRLMNQSNWSRIFKLLKQPNKIKYTGQPHDNSDLLSVPVKWFAHFAIRKAIIGDSHHQAPESQRCRRAMLQQAVKLNINTRFCISTHEMHWRWLPLTSLCVGNIKSFTGTWTDLYSDLDSVALRILYSVRTEELTVLATSSKSFSTLRFTEKTELHCFSFEYFQSNSMQ